MNPERDSKIRLIKTNNMINFTCFKQINYKTRIMFLENIILSRTG